MPHRLLVLEDEWFIAAMISEIAEDMGYAVSIAHNLPQAQLALNHSHFDAALIDYHIDGGPTVTIPDLLLERGVPYAFTSGYSVIEHQAHTSAILLQKPFTERALRGVLASLVNAGI